MSIKVKEKFFANVGGILEQARQNEKAVIDFSMVHAYFEIGRLIVKEEQNGGHLAFSRDKDRIKELSQEGQVIEKPKDVLKKPYILKFTEIEERAGFFESELESRLLNHLQDFLFELGKGFAFIGKQVRFTFDEKHFRVDRVFYNRLLHCFLVFDLKIGELIHQDLRQMQMYVNYYDRYEKIADENPTVGVLLCQQKSDALVELTLPNDSNIYASQYQLYLSDKKELQKKLKEWIAEETGGKDI